MVSDLRLSRLEISVGRPQQGPASSASYGLIYATARQVRSRGMPRWWRRCRSAVPGRCVRRAGSAISPRVANSVGSRGNKNRSSVGHIGGGLCEHGLGQPLVSGRGRPRSSRHQDQPHITRLRARRCGIATENGRRLSFRALTASRRSTASRPGEGRTRRGAEVGLGRFTSGSSRWRRPRRRAERPGGGGLCAQDIRHIDQRGHLPLTT